MQKGFLEVGNDGKEVIVNHPDLLPDKDGVGHITFSPKQARDFAALLIKNADELAAALDTPQEPTPDAPPALTREQFWSCLQFDRFGSIQVDLSIEALNRLLAPYNCAAPRPALSPDAPEK